MGKDAALVLKQERPEESTSEPSTSQQLQQRSDSPSQQDSLFTTTEPVPTSSSSVTTLNTSEVIKNTTASIMEVISNATTSSPILIAPAGPVTSVPVGVSTPLLGPICPFPTKLDSSGRSSISIRSAKAQKLLKEGFDVMKTVAEAKLLLNTTSMTQRALGNTILGLSQASVSDLLCKCRPWDQILGTKPRESYVRLKLWVDSVREASGYTEDNGESQDIAEPNAKPQRIESESPPIVVSMKEEPSEPTAAAAQEVQDKQLTEQQLDVLVNFFDQCPDPDPNDVSELVKQIGSTLDVIFEEAPIECNVSVADKPIEDFMRFKALSNIDTLVGITTMQSKNCVLFSILLVNEWFEKRRQEVKAGLIPPIREEVPQPIIERDCASPTPLISQSIPATTSLNRRKKAVPTRIVPASQIILPLESTVPTASPPTSTTF
ncbi:hypothetical protein ACTXT7_015236 [Hymenolepis weldensis]